MARARNETRPRNTPTAVPRSASSRETAPPRRRGGQELPDNVQDRPEQNAGYDEAVRNGPAGEAPELDLSLADRDVDTAGLGWDDGADAAGDGEVVDPDTREERAASSEVRRRERRGADR